MKSCSVCGKRFEVRNHNHIFCSPDCGKLSSNKVAKEKLVRIRKLATDVKQGKFPYAKLLKMITNKAESKAIKVILKKF